MKSLNKYISESLLTGKVSKPSTHTQPQSREELEQIIDEYIKEIKPRPGQEVDLNWIDISRVDDLSELFEYTSYIPIIDAWKIDHVKNFIYMFADNKYIVRSPIPVLQEKLLESNCYRRMFNGCSALKVAPALPAMKLTDGCYTAMFEGCSALKVAPELPAKKLAERCYRSMFEGCTSLKVAPELPAKKLESYCYSRMFYGCTSLKVAPELPAENLVDGCYADMFKGCPYGNK